VGFQSPRPTTTTSSKERSMQALLTTIPYPNSITPVFAQPVDESGLHDDLRKRGWQLEKIAAYRRLGDEERKGRVIDASTATQGLFGGSGVTEVPWDPLKCSRDVVELLLKRLPEAAHVKAVMLYVHGLMDSTPLRRLGGPSGWPSLASESRRTLAHGPRARPRPGGSRPRRRGRGPRRRRPPPARPTGS